LSDIPEFRYRAHGLVLKTLNYRACVTFYREVFGLDTRFEEDQQTCLRFGDGFLVLERGGVGSTELKKSDQFPPVIQFIVDDVAIAAGELSMRGATVKIRDDERGSVATLTDPDGNLCEIIASDSSFS
jgi:lactoylglutathione lyase